MQKVQHTLSRGSYQQQVRLVERCGLSYVHVFPYSVRPGTPAARMPQVPGAVIRQRAGRLRVKLSGDLEGFLAGLVLGSGEETRLEITQEVVARKPLLRRLDPFARPLFRANHAMMMRRGRRGLRTHLAA